MEQLFRDGMVQHPDEVSALSIGYLVEFLGYLRSVLHFAGDRGGVLECVGTEEIHLVPGEGFEHVPFGFHLGIETGVWNKLF